MRCFRHFNEARRYERALTIGALLALGMLTACAVPVSTQVREKGKAAVIVANAVEQDTEDSFVRHNADHGYHMLLSVAPREDAADDDAESIHNSTLLEIQNTDTGRKKWTWLAYSVEPGQYLLARTVEWKQIGFAIWDRASKVTSFVVPTALKENGKPVSVASDETPQFEIAAGEVVYIGTFGSRLDTDGGLLFITPLVEKAQKFYRMETERARRIVDDSSLKGLPFRTVDIFAGRREAVSLYDRAWTSDEDERLVIPTGPEARLAASR